jgi:hypothetical protein
MSIFRYLRSSVSPLRLFVDNPNVDAWWLPCLVFAGLLVFLTCLWRRTEPATSALLAVITTLLFYKVGFPQYQMILFLLMACWMRYHWRELTEHRGLAVAIASYFGWLTLFDSLYCYIGGGYIQGPWFDWLSDWAGLPTFGLGGFLLVSLLRVEGRTEERTELEART